MTRTLPALLIAIVACGPSALPGDDEVGSGDSSTSAEESGTGDSDTSDTDTGTSETGSTVPEDCWESLAEGSVQVVDVWGQSTAQMLISTNAGVLRVEGDTFTTLGEGAFGPIWASSLDAGWTVQAGALQTIVDGVIDPWPEELAFTITAIDGRNASDVFAAGVVITAEDNYVGPGLAHFDGTGWTPIDLEPILGSTFDQFFFYDAAVTGDTAYFGGQHPYNSGLVAWNGSGSLTPPSPNGEDYVARLSTRDGVRPLWHYVWCDFGCFADAYEFDGEAWGVVQLPGGVELQAIDLHAVPGATWALLGAYVGGGEQVARQVDGAWQSAEAPGAARVFAMPDGVVLDRVPRRATSACLFGE